MSLSVFLKKAHDKFLTKIHCKIWSRCEGLDQQEKLGVWSLLNAKTKQALKKYIET
jgi:hypothetical protein